MHVKRRPAPLWASELCQIGFATHLMPQHSKYVKGCEATLEASSCGRLKFALTWAQKSSCRARHRCQMVQRPT